MTIAPVRDAGASMQRDRPKGWVRAIATASVTAVVLSTASAATTDTPGHPDAGPRRVVILNAADPYLPAFVALDRGMREAILAGRTAPTSFHAEALDMFRFPQAQIDGDVVSLLRKKYRDLEVDVVVAAAEIALEFAERHRADIWPKAAIVFHSVSEARLQEATLAPDTIGIPVRLEYGTTLDLALRLRPDTRQVVVVAGTAEPDRDNLALARRALGHYAGRLDVRYLVGLDVAATVAAVRTLPDDAVVLFVTAFRDGDGTPLVPRDVLTQVAAASSVPVFGVFETYLGDGIVAGAITSYGRQGRRAGDLVVRILSGEAPSAIGIQPPAAPVCMADAQALRRWRIDRSLLPAGCDVRFDEATIWDRYRVEIVATLAVILVQSALIGALLVNRRKLRAAQASSQREFEGRRQAEAFADALRSRLARFGRQRSLGMMATAISHEINQPLIAIQNYAQAALRHLRGDAGNVPKLTELVAKIEGQAARAGAITQRVRSLVSTSEVEPVAVALGPLLEEAVRITKSEVAPTGSRIDLDNPRDLPRVLADPLQVQLVVVNLVRNAVESVCSSDRYERRVSVDARATDDVEVQVSVADRGAGVAPDRVADLFEPLYTGTDGGMGMGLAIARAIVEAHGGRLWYERNPEGGAIFRFTLRIAPT